MKLTRHAVVRGRQRGFSSLSLEIIQQYGRCKKAPGGATMFFFGKKEYQHAVGNLKNTIRFTNQEDRDSIQKTIQLMDRAKGGKIIMKDGYVITAYK